MSLPEIKLSKLKSYIVSVQKIKEKEEMAKKGKKEKSLFKEVRMDDLKNKIE